MGHSFSVSVDRYPLPSLVKCLALFIIIGTSATTIATSASSSGGAPVVNVVAYTTVRVRKVLFIRLCVCIFIIIIIIIMQSVLLFNSVYIYSV